MDAETQGWGFGPIQLAWAAGFIDAALQMERLQVRRMAVCMCSNMALSLRCQKEADKGNPCNSKEAS
jgi:hypothetical protein